MRRVVLAIAVVLAVGAAHAARAADPAPAPPASVSVSATDGPLTARLTATPSRPAPGVAVDLHLEARLDAADGAEIVWPDVRAALVEALGKDVVEVESARPSADRRSYDARLRLYDEGAHELPPLTVAARRGAETLGAVAVSGAVLNVDVDVPADAEPAPAKEPLPLDVPPAPFPWWKAGTAAAALAALLAAALLVRRRRGAEDAVEDAPPPPPPHARALAALRDLEARALLERGEVEPYFVALSEILRTYLEERFGLRAPEQTTEEFLASVSRTDAGRRAVETAHRELLRDFLERADLVKFARARPPADECRAAASSAERFVRDTAPGDVPEVPA